MDRLRRLRGDGNDVFSPLRTVWQRQNGVSYIVAGSRVSLMRRILTEKDNPFLQPFEMLSLGPFAREDSLQMFRDMTGPPAVSPRARP